MRYIYNLLSLITLGIIIIYTTIYLTNILNGVDQLMLGLFGLAIFIGTMISQMEEKKWDS